MTLIADSRNEIFSQRLLKAVLWNITLQIILSVILVLLIQIDILHPVTWITSTFYNIVSYNMTLNIVPLVLVTFFQAFIYGRYYMVPPPKYFTRFSMFLNLFTVQNVAFSILYALSGYFTMGLYSSLANSNFSVLKKSCMQSEGQCLVEDSLFLQLGGMWMGLYHFLSIHIFGTTLLIFPHIVQDKVLQIKMAVNNVVVMGFKKSVPPVLYFCLFYYIWGNKPRNLVSDVYSVYLEDPPLDNIVNLVKSGIWIGLWFYTSLFLITMYIMRTVFNIILTEPLKFPIESSSGITLHEALSQRSQFNGFLGAQDLRIVAMTDPQRRHAIFTLSQPGGHPRNWNNILEQCLRTIHCFSNDLENIYNNIKPYEDPAPILKPLGSVMPPGYPVQTSIRKLAQSPRLYELNDHNKNKLEDTLVNSAKQEFQTIIQKLCQKPGISYFFGELTDSKLKFLLMQAQPVMWTCEGLAFVSAASLQEDKYGIVQNDLPVIIAALIKLKHNLEKLTKLGLVPKKQLNDVFATKMKTALMSALKRSIYKIVLTFSKYINDIPMDSELQLAIQPYLLCKEA